MSKHYTPCDYGGCPYDARYSEDCRVHCGLGVDEDMAPTDGLTEDDPLFHDIVDMEAVNTVAEALRKMKSRAAYYRSIGSMEAAAAYDSAASMLEYALAGDAQALDQFDDYEDICPERKDGQHHYIHTIKHGWLCEHCGAAMPDPPATEPPPYDHP